MRIQALGVSLGNPTNVLTLHSNIFFNIQHGDTTAGDNGYAKVVHILPTAVWQFPAQRRRWRLSAQYLIRAGNQCGPVFLQRGRRQR